MHGRITSPLGLLVLIVLAAHWRCCSWAAGDKCSAFKAALGRLSETAQNTFLTAALLLSLLTLSLGSARIPTHSAGIKVFTYLAFS